jgi:hypothetical protein
VYPAALSRRETRSLPVGRVGRLPSEDDLRATRRALAFGSCALDARCKHAAKTGTARVRMDARAADSEGKYSEVGL